MCCNHSFMSWVLSFGFDAGIINPMITPTAKQQKISRALGICIFQNHRRTSTISVFWSANMTMRMVKKMIIMVLVFIKQCIVISTYMVQRVTNIKLQNSFRFQIFCQDRKKRVSGREALPVRIGKLPTRNK